MPHAKSQRRAKVPYVLTAYAHRGLITPRRVNAESGRQVSARESPRIYARVRSKRVCHVVASRYAARASLRHSRYIAACAQSPCSSAYVTPMRTRRQFTRHAPYAARISARCVAGAAMSRAHALPCNADAMPRTNVRNARSYGNVVGARGARNARTMRYACPSIVAARAPICVSRSYGARLLYACMLLYVRRGVMRCACRGYVVEPERTSVVKCSRAAVRGAVLLMLDLRLRCFRQLLFAGCRRYCHTLSSFSGFSDADYFDRCRCADG